MYHYQILKKAVLDMGRRSDHTITQLINMILDAAEQLIVEQGIQKTSARKIASKIDYSVGTIYNVYKNIDDVFLNLNGRTLDYLLKDLSESFDSMDSAPIKKIAYSYLEFSQNHSNLWELLFEYRFADDISVPRWYNEKIEKIYSLVGEAINGSLQIDDEQKLKECITVLWSGIHGVCVLSAKGKLNRIGMSNARNLLDSFVDNYLNGIKLSGS